MKFYSYFVGKTQFHKYFWVLYFLLGVGGSGEQITASFACDIDQEERVVALLYYDFAVVWLFMFGISSMPFRG